MSVIPRDKTVYLKRFTVPNHLELSATEQSIDYVSIPLSYVKPSIKFFLNFQENNNFNVNTYSFKFIHTSVKLVMFKQTPKHNYKIYNRTCLLKIRHVFLDY